jgi:hypothetical protein
MSAIKHHVVLPQTETYDLKLKDTAEASAVEIKAENGLWLELESIKIIKIPQQNNRIVIELVKKMPEGGEES